MLETYQTHSTFCGAECIHVLELFVQTVFLIFNLKF